MTEPDIEGYELDQQHRRDAAKDEAVGQHEVSDWYEVKHCVECDGAVNWDGRNYVHVLEVIQ